MSEKLYNILIIKLYYSKNGTYMHMFVYNEYFNNLY